MRTVGHWIWHARPSGWTAVKCEPQAKHRATSRRGRRETGHLTLENPWGRVQNAQVRCSAAILRLPPSHSTVTPPVVTELSWTTPTITECLGVQLCPLEGPQGCSPGGGRWSSPVLPPAIRVGPIPSLPQLDTPRKISCWEKELHYQNKSVSSCRLLMLSVLTRRQTSTGSQN